uniref:G_PROTEIN_RECEP_F1_2 domain-containing protein n=1 Tax=Parastrongyloides trichosuri TaxID=131310 RepID=A0A0N4Z4I7_PARTI
MVLDSNHTTTTDLTTLSVTTTATILEHLTTTVSKNISHVIRTECFTNISKDERYDLIKQRQSGKLEDVYRRYYGWMPLPFTILATILTLLFLISTYRAIKQQRVSRKCYVLLFNRSIGDLIGCISNFSVIGYCLLASKVNRDIVQILDIFFMGSFWAGMVSYVSLSLLKLYAVSKPFSYRNKVTMRRVIYVIIFSWIIFLFMIFYAILVTAMVKVPYLNAITGCRLETCLRVMYRSRNFLAIVVYFFTLVIFLGTLLYVRKARNFVNSFNKKNSSKHVMSTRFPFWKLTLNVATFATMDGFYVIWAIFLQINTDQCYFQKHLSQMMSYMGFVRLSLIIRMCVDPILTFITDFQVRRSLFNILGIHGRINPLSSQKNMIKKSGEEIEEDINSSEYNEKKPKLSSGTGNTILTNASSLKTNKEDNVEQMIVIPTIHEEEPDSNVIEVVKEEDIPNTSKEDKKE